MIKLVDILNEIVPPKNTWFPLSKAEVQDVEKEILDLINNAYGSIGGHPNYKSVNDLAGSEYEIIDLDEKDVGKIKLKKNLLGKKIKSIEVFVRVENSN